MKSLPHAHTRMQLARCVVTMWRRPLGAACRPLAAGDGTAHPRHLPNRTRALSSPSDQPISPSQCPIACLRAPAQACHRGPPRRHPPVAITTVHSPPAMRLHTLALPPVRVHNKAYLPHEDPSPPIHWRPPTPACRHGQPPRAPTAPPVPGRVHAHPIACPAPSRHPYPLFSLSRYERSPSPLAGAALCPFPCPSPSSATLRAAPKPPEYANGSHVPIHSSPSLSPAPFTVAVVGAKAPLPHPRPPRRVPPPHLLHPQTLQQQDSR